MGFRLTVHIEKAPKIVDEKTKTTKGIRNTISVRNIPSRNQVELELVRLRENYTIAKGKDRSKKHKYGKELVYVSYEK